MGLLRGADQRLNVVVADAIATNLDLVAGKVAFSKPDGTYMATPYTDGKAFKIHFKDAGGNSAYYDIPAGAASRVQATAVAETMQAEQLVIPTMVAGTVALVKLIIRNYGGMVSPNDDYTIYASHTVKTGNVHLSDPYRVGAENLEYIHERRLLRKVWVRCD